MEVFYVFFGIFMFVFICAMVTAIVIVVTKVNQKDKKGKKEKGDFLSPKPAEAKREGDPFTGYRENASKPAEKPNEVSPVHANCDHAKTPSPYIDINDTYSMTWDEFKSFALKLLSAEYPTAHISPYKYRGSPDIQLKTGGKDVDVRLIHLRERGVVDKDDFAAALRDVDEKDDVADWIFTNGAFTVMQRSSANAKRVALYDAGDMLAMMRRCNISAKER